MSDIERLERDLLAAVNDARDETALETLRVATLGKKGSISELLKTLGTMPPDERSARPASWCRAFSATR